MPDSLCSVAQIGRLHRQHRRADAVPARRQRGALPLLQPKQRLAVRSRQVWSTTIETLTAEIAGSSHRSEHSSTHIPIRRSSHAIARSEIVRAANLLAEIGDCRNRFPTYDALATLAGVSPSTRQSGKHAQTAFCWPCNKKLRGHGFRER
ncbi:transposase [Rhodococcus globerulus]|uniref:transposase n=1 Tax=Rhodococcus globerulus TaxID=33008 RepID=UPI001C59AA13|nr:transposase [Rhodococcus globerulus]QXW01355.1 IS110 family transposase [Rhodococcus globerulus]